MYFARGTGTKFANGLDMVGGKENLKMKPRLLVYVIY